MSHASAGGGISTPPPGRTLLVGPGSDTLLALNRPSPATVGAQPSAGR